MRTVHKYPFEIKEYQVLQIPRGAKVIHASLDPFGQPALWATVDDGDEMKPFQLYVVATGGKLPLEAPKHLGSFVWVVNNTMWHCFGA